MSDRSLFVVSCTVGGGGLLRGVVAVIAAAFAVTLLPLQPIVAAVAGAVSVFAAVMAITGWCPADWLAARRQQGTAPNELGLPDAREHLDLIPAATPNRSSHVD